MKTKWETLDILLVNAKETKIIGKANISVSCDDITGKAMRLQYMTIEEHSFQETTSFDGTTVTYKHMKSCGTCSQKASA